MSDLEPIQRSRLDEIGQLLAKAREEKGLTLEEVSGKTLIRASILKAIEEGDARPLPEPVYIRGFIRRFGDSVGLNGMELCDSFPWQPSGSVPLSFVSAGAVAEARPAEQVAEENAVSSASPAVSRELEVESAEASVAVAADSPVVQPLTAVTGVADPQVTETADEPLAPPAEAPAQVSLSSSEIDANQVEAVADTAIPQREAEPQDVTPNHEAAYESRAALFSEDVESVDRPVAMADGAVSAGAAAIPAAAREIMTPPSQPEAIAVPGNEPVAEAASASEASSQASSPPGVATLPTPPAPVMYREPEQRSLMPWLLALVVGAVGLGIAALAFGGGNRQSTPNVANDSPAVEQIETAEEESASGSETVADTADSQPPKVEVPVDKVVLELEVKGAEAAWMDVFVDGEPQIEGIQPPGFKQRWEGSQNIDLATARPDLVWVSVNGSESKPFGDSPALKTEIFKPLNAQ